MADKSNDKKLSKSELTNFVGKLNYKMNKKTLENLIKVGKLRGRNFFRQISTIACFHQRLAT